MSKFSVRHRLHGMFFFPGKVFGLVVKLAGMEASNI